MDKVADEATAHPAFLGYLKVEFRREVLYARCRLERAARIVGLVVGPVYRERAKLSLPWISPHERVAPGA
jgi:hypothetical protein